MTIVTTEIHYIYIIIIEIRRYITYRMQWIQKLMFQNRMTEMAEAQGQIAAKKSELASKQAETKALGEKKSYDKSMIRKYEGRVAAQKAAVDVIMKSVPKVTKLEQRKISFRTDIKASISTAQKDIVDYQAKINRSRKELAGWEQKLTIVTVKSEIVIIQVQITRITVVIHEYEVQIKSRQKSIKEGKFK
jgi:chromosome segregation ATPase